jgi:hypothetical protein
LHDPIFEIRILIKRSWFFDRLPLFTGRLTRRLALCAIEEILAQEREDDLSGSSHPDRKTSTWSGLLGLRSGILLDCRLIGTGALADHCKKQDSENGSQLFSQKHWPLSLKSWGYVAPVTLYHPLDESRRVMLSFVLK